MLSIARALNPFRPSGCAPLDSSEQAEITMTGPGVDEIQPHDLLQPVPRNNLGVRDALNKLRTALPSATEACDAAKVTGKAAGKFAACVVPTCLAGASLGVANYYFYRGPASLVFDASFTDGADARAMAWAGVAAGIVEAGLLATNCNVKASALAVGALAGTAGCFLGTFVGAVLGSMVGGAASLPNLGAWMVNSPWRIHVFSPVFYVAAPIAQTLVALGAGVAAGGSVHEEMRQQSRLATSPV